MGDGFCVCGVSIFNTGERVSWIFQGETSFSTSDSWTKIRYPNGKKVSCGAHLMGDQIATAPLDTNEERKAITEIINHPNYNDVTLDNDIAVIKVADGDTFNCGANIFPACLPSTNVRSSKCPLRSLICILYCRGTSMLAGRTPLFLAGVQTPREDSYQIPWSGSMFLQYQVHLVTGPALIMGQ